MAEATQTQTRTAMVDGKEMEADKAAAIHEVREIFNKLKRALKTIALYRHNVERYAEYLEPVHTALADFLDRKGILSLKVEALSFKYQNSVVFEDDSRENNLIYPFWQSGIRLFIFKPGLSPDELLGFIMLVLGDPNDRGRPVEDVITRLWKAEFATIEYIVVESFQVASDDDPEEVEIEVEKVVAYLYRQLQSNSDDYLRFARLSVEDLNLELDNIDQMRGAVVQGVTASAADKQRVQTMWGKEGEMTMVKLVTVLFQLLELDTREENFEDVAEAFVQLLDALLIREEFRSIHKIRQRFQQSASASHLSDLSRDLVQRCGERFATRMAESQRLQTIGQILNQGVVRDPEALRLYFGAMGSDAVQPLVEMLETLELPPNRRYICDVLSELGKEKVDIFVTRLNHASSNVVKDMLYIIDKIDPPEKFGYFSVVLQNENAILRLETLSLIGKNPSDECYQLIKKTFEEHADAQMRGQAARCLPNYEPDAASAVLLKKVKSAKFETISEPEKKAIFVALGQTQSEKAQNFLTEILESKRGFFGKRKIDDLKLLAISGLENNPSMGSLKLLADIAKDPKKHSKEICAVAKAAVLEMQSKIMGMG
jgi:hypothetical protein